MDKEEGIRNSSFISHPSSLLSLCLSVDSVAVVGTAKNVGKTTTLNWLLDEATAAGRSVALTSMGRDGEETDLLTGEAKPRIRAPLGALVLTACGTIRDTTSARRTPSAVRRSCAHLQLLAETPIRNALGPIGIYRVQKAGLVELAGPVMVEDSAWAVERLRQLGSQLVLVDGAIDRRAGASAAVCRGVVLATGAAVCDPDKPRSVGATARVTDLAQAVEAVAGRTAQAVWALSLPLLDDPTLAGIAAAAQRQGQMIGIDSHGNHRSLPLERILADPDELARQLPTDLAYLLWSGALTDRPLAALLRRSLKYPGLTIVIREGTHVLLSPAVYARFRQSNWDMRVVKAIRLLGLTVNPLGPYGLVLPGGVLLARLRQEFPSLPVAEVVSHL